MVWFFPNCLIEYILFTFVVNICSHDNQAAEKEKQQQMAVERQKAADETAAKLEAPSVVDTVKEIKAPAIQVPDIKVPDFKAPAMPDMKSFSLPKVDIPKMPEIKVPAVPKPAATVDIKAPALPAFDVPKMPAFSLPKVPDMPKLDIPAAPKFDSPKYDFDSPKFDMPAAPAKSSVDENLEPQEVRDARAADANVSFKAAQAEAKVSNVVLRRFVCPDGHNLE